MVALLAASMCGYGVSEVGTGVSEQVDEMVNGAGLALGSITGPRASGSGRIMGAETSVHNELAEVGGSLLQVTREVW